MVVAIDALKFMNYGPVLVNLCGVNQFRSWAFFNASVNVVDFDIISIFLVINCFVYTNIVNYFNIQALK